MSVQLSKLQAVNMMLRYVGQAPINSLQSSGRLGSQAIDILDEITVITQQKPYYFNYQKTTLSPNLDKEILLGESVLEVDPFCIENMYSTIDGKLYNFVKETFEFENDVEVYVLYFYPYEELTYSVQHYIAMAASKELFSIRFPKTQISPSLQERFLRAEATLNQHDARVGNYSLLKNKTIAQILI